MCYLILFPPPPFKRSLTHSNTITRVIYEEVISKLCNYVLHPSVLDPIKECLQPFKREVIPNLLIWATYPLTSLIELVWKQNSRHLELGNDKIDPYHVEFMAMLERTLNYAHTGSGKVITRKVMTPSFLAQSLVHDGFLCLNKRIVSFPELTTKSLLLLDNTWWARTDKRPLMASLRVQELTFGKLHARVSFSDIYLTSAT